MTDKNDNICEPTREISPVAYIKTDLKNKFGIPRQSGRISALVGRIEFVPEWRNADAVRELDGFSHLWLIFDFSKAHKEKPAPTVRPPRLGGNRRVGVFASRSPFRPNSLGLSCVKLEKIEHTKNSGTVLVVSGVDLLDGTPIYDIKPYIPYADCVPDAVGGYADAEAEHRLEVDFPEELARLLPDSSYDAVTAMIADDPRPAYINDPLREYTVTYGDNEIDFHIDGSCAHVYRVRRVADIANSPH